MKIKIILIIILLLAAIKLLSLAFVQSPVGPHDGLVKKADDYNIEMKNSLPNFYAYLLDKRNRPMGNKGISCEVRFMFPDSTTIDAVLKPFGTDGFSMESGFLKFYSCRIRFNVYGKTVSAQFDNENLIVQKK